ncbi:MAG TPA: hypothetical protein VM260_09840, partial [Pirellula sp.]|nr:hypothetical protein [Pirellula sp.]
RVLPQLWTFIGLVCVYDVYLSLKYSASLKYLELNPVGVWLLHLRNGDPDLFMAVKIVSSLVVLSLLYASHRRYSRLCWLLTCSITAFQFGLMAFLTFV